MKNRLTIAQQIKLLKTILVSLIIFVFITWVYMFNELYVIVSPIQKKTTPVKTVIKKVSIVPVANAEAPKPKNVETDSHSGAGANFYKDFIYFKESGNRTDAINKSSGACGLGQAYPCEKLPCSLQDYECQDKWFSNYAMERYGGWENAYYFWLNNRWW